MVIISYDYCCAHSEIGLRRISAAVGLAAADRIATLAGRFRPATGYDAAALGLTPDLLAQADAIHRRLRRVAGDAIIPPMR